MEMDRPCLTYGQQDLNNSIDMRTEGKLKELDDQKQLGEGW